MTKKALLLVLLVAVVFVLAGSQAQAQGTRYKAWASAALVVPFGDETTDIFGSEDVVELTEDLGIDIGFEWRTSWWGLALDYAQTEPEVETGFFDTIGTVKSDPISLTANFHLVHTRVIDFYFGPTVSWILWDDIKLNDGTKIKTDSSFAYGASLGVDFSLIKLIAIAINVRYTVEELEARDVKISVNPLMVTAGVAFRWGKLN